DRLPTHSQPQRLEPDLAYLHRQDRCEFGATTPIHGHDDASRLTKADVVAWKDALLPALVNQRP
ncbi:hypothetical protein, partial [Xanthobacter versatilis]|uniref:hypothetical protein n=1 Tax=Xanthobacter autotrophicus (strain ATCC BAA-1158 / Py2) TaxID=78245 RepID=UPI003728E01C